MTSYSKEFKMNNHLALSEFELHVLAEVIVTTEEQAKSYNELIILKAALLKVGFFPEPTFLAY